MRTPDYTGQFKRDYKREKKGLYHATLDTDLRVILPALLTNQPLEPRHHDHSLACDWKDHRDCHVIKPDPDMLRLVRLGTHSELGL